MTAQTSRPVVILLSIGDEGDRQMTDAVWASLINQLEARSILHRATTADEARILMDQYPNPHGIFVPDTGITKKKNDAVSQRLVQYVRMGGTAVLGGTFSSMMRPPDFDRYFEKAWTLPWKSGDYCRTTVSLNPSSTGRPRSGLPPSYSQKAVSLKNVSRASAWYLPGEDSVIESLVFRPDPISDKTQAPVAFEQIGDGYLGYTGDVNAEAETTAVVLAMLKLLDD